MFRRWTALVGLAVVLAPLPASATDGQYSSLSDTGFKDWTGLLTQTTLDDDSVLSEYKALTHSRETPGAMLEVVFVPRFSCAPVTRVIVADQDARPVGEQDQIWLTIDGEQVEFPALVDSYPTTQEYSFLAARSRQQQLREVFDRASHLQVHWTDISEEADGLAEPRTAEPVRFSLLGSRLSVKAVESHCRGHVPLPYELPVSD